MIEALPIVKRRKLGQPMKGMSDMESEPEPEKKPKKKNLSSDEEENSEDIKMARGSKSYDDDSSGETPEPDPTKRDKRNFSFLAIPPPRFHGTINEEGNPI